MALIVPYESKEQIHTAGDPGPVAQKRGAGEFMSAGGNMWPDALANLARGLDKVGDALHAEDVRKREEAFQLELLQDVNQYKADAQKYFDDYSQAYQGQDAAFAERDLGGWHQERLDGLKAKWQGNERAQIYLAQHGDAVAMSGVNAGREYGNRQMDAWKDSVMMGDQAEYLQFASDPRRTPEEIMAASDPYLRRQVGYWQSKGLDYRSAVAKAEAMRREAVRNNLKSRIGQGIADNPGEAARVIMGTPRSAALPSAVAGLAEKEAAAQGVDSALVKAVIGAESGGNPNAVSKAGALGLMQLMPGTALDLGVTNPTNPEQNVRGGTKYLATLLKRYNGDKPLALMAYNWGMGKVDKWLAGGRKGDVPAETRKYVRNVMTDYRMQTGGGAGPAGGSGGRLARPLAGNVRISSGFGHRTAPQTPNGPGSSNHQGIDYAVPVGTPVASAGAGKVAFVGRKGGYGLQVVIDHGDGTESWYSHLSDTGGLKAGDSVGQGQQIALSGGAKGDPNAGKSTGPHLDFKVRKNGEFVDPEALFQGGDSEPGGGGQAVMVASLGPGVGAGDGVVSDAYGVAPSASGEKPGGPLVLPGPTASAGEERSAPVVSDGTGAGAADNWDDGDDWRLGDDAALIEEYFSPEERAEMLGELEKSQTAQRKAYRENLKAGLDQDVLNRSLTQEKLMTALPYLEREDQVYYFKALNDEAGIWAEVKKQDVKNLDKAVWTNVLGGKLYDAAGLRRYIRENNMWELVSPETLAKYDKWIEDGGEALNKAIDQFIVKNSDKLKPQGTAYFILGGDGKKKSVADAANLERFKTVALEAMHEFEVTAQTEPKEVQELLTAVWNNYQKERPLDYIKSSVYTGETESELIRELARKRLDGGAEVITPYNLDRARRAVLDGKPMKEVMAADADKWKGRGLMTLKKLSGPVADHKAAFERAGNSYNVDPNLLAAIAQAVRGKGGTITSARQKVSVGLMGLNQQAAANMGVEAPDDPTQSILGAAKLMDQLLMANNGDLDGALVAYAVGLDEKEMVQFVKDVKMAYSDLPQLTMGPRTSQRKDGTFPPLFNFKLKFWEDWED